MIKKKKEMAISTSVYTCVQISSPRIALSTSMQLTSSSHPTLNVNHLNRYRSTFVPRLTACDRRVVTLIPPYQPSALPDMRLGENHSQNHSNHCRKYSNRQSLSSVCLEFCPLTAPQGWREVELEYFSGLLGWQEGKRRTGN